MASEQARALAELFASTRERFSSPNLDLATVRDICESLHAAGSEPAGVTYAEVSAAGEPAMWCIPDDCAKDRVLLHQHADGTVVFSMHSDRKAAGHLANAAGGRALVLDYRRAPKTSSLPKQRTSRRHIAGCSTKAPARTASPARATRSAATLP
jgi:epsilon-lactone hydrolase